MKNDNGITESIIGSAFKVHNTLGSGFLEKVYANALAIELREIGLNVQPEKQLSVMYNGQPVGHYVADLIVSEDVICEIKAVRQLSKIHEVQLVNYLAATGITIELLINFGASVEVRRKHKTFKP